MKLTVIYRDEMPYLMFQDRPRYRSISIELTEEQIEKLKTRQVGTMNGNRIMEDISQVFIEDLKEEEYSNG